MAHINTGTLGFLGDEPEDINEYVETILRGDFQTEERMMLSAECDGFSTVSLNDVVIKNGATARVIELRLSIDGRFVSRVKGDGIVISTPTGSTAYSLAAGGPVVEPGLRVVIVSPLNPHSLNSRSIVISPGSCLEIAAPVSGQEVILTSDGQVSYRITPPGSAVVRVSDARLRLIKSKRFFFTLLSQKMNWGV